MLAVSSTMPPLRGRPLTKPCVRVRTRRFIPISHKCGETSPGVVRFLRGFSDLGRRIRPGSRLLPLRTVGPSSTLRHCPGLPCAISSKPDPPPIAPTPHPPPPRPMPPPPPRQKKWNDQKRPPLTLSEWHPVGEGCRPEQIRVTPITKIEQALTDQSDTHHQNGPGLNRSE